MDFKPRPALYFLIPYLLGIVVGHYTSVPPFWLWLFTLICLISTIFFLQFTTGKSRVLVYVLMHIAIFASGMLRLNIAEVSPIPPHFYDVPVVFSGRTLYQPERGETWEACYAVGGIKLLSPETATDDVAADNVQAKVLIEFQELMPLQYGKRLTLMGVLRQPQAQRNPGGFDYRAYLGRQNVHGIIYAQGPVQIGEHAGFPLLRWIEAFRLRTEAVIDTVYASTPLHAKLVKGILLGKRGDVPSETLEIFRNSGTFHLLAVSGLHVGLIAAFCYFGLSRFRIPKKVRCLLTIVAVLIYACIVGFRPSVFRASLMAILFLFATIIDRDTDIFNLLAVAASVLLLLNPTQLWDIGFQLSFVAVAAIVYFVPKMEKPLRGWWQPPEFYGDDKARFRYLFGTLRCLALKWLALSHLVTFAAQLGTGPIIALHFFRAYPLGLIVGPFAVGLVSLIVAISMGTIFVGLIWLPLAKLIAMCNHALISLFLQLISIFGQSSGVLKVTPPTLAFFFLYAGLCIGIAQWRYVYKQWRLATLIGLSLIAVWVWDSAFHEKGNLLEFITLDVGQGDAAVIISPDKRTMLIDGGVRRAYYNKKKQKHVEYDAGKRIVAPYLDSQGIRELDMVMLTHPDIDHGGGLAYILQNFEVKQILGISDGVFSSSNLTRLRSIAKEKGIPYSFEYGGDIELMPTVTLTLLHPIDAAATNLRDADTNNDSLVMKLSYGVVDILFTGDIGAQAESQLIAAGQELRSDILKVPHHGSRTSSTTKFLDAVQSQYAIFSLGKGNPFRFPHPDVVSRYEERACVMLRTDELGAITFKTDGTRGWFRYHVVDKTVRSDLMRDAK